MHSLQAAENLLRLICSQNHMNKFCKWGWIKWLFQKLLWDHPQHSLNYCKAFCPEIIVYLIVVSNKYIRKNAFSHLIMQFAVALLEKLQFQVLVFLSSFVVCLQFLLILFTSLMTENELGNFYCRNITCGE